jgi:hypothetical protein
MQEQGYNETAIQEGFFFSWDFGLGFKMYSSNREKRNWLQWHFNHNFHDYSVRCPPWRGVVLLSPFRGIRPERVSPEEMIAMFPVAEMMPAALSLGTAPLDQLVGSFLSLLIALLS